jgi:DNA end-binding protein Ku
MTGGKEDRLLKPFLEPLCLIYMTHALWTGHISFGLLHIPVSLHSAENRPEELHFHMIDSRNNARVRYERVNEVTGEKVPWNAVVKGYEYGHGRLVLLKDDDFKRADVKATQSIEIEDFVDRHAVDCFHFDKPYMIVPEKKGEKGYVLLREALRRTERIGIAHVVMRAREHIAGLMPRDNGLILHLLRHPSELRKPADFDLPSQGLERYGISKQEIAMAEKFVDNFSSAWMPEKYKDRYRDSLAKLIQHKAHAGPKAAPPLPVQEEEPVNTSEVDVMDLLRKSMRHHANLDHRAGPAR